jgi:capsular polysaccharide biosynthesis protein
MKNRYRIIFALSVTALFVVGVAFGATNQTNITDVNETHENETNATEIAIEAGNTTAMPVNTTVEPATAVETTIEPTIPVSTTKPSPGFEIVVTIVAGLSAVYIFGKRR